jgi:hypothetical protein
MPVSGGTTLKSSKALAVALELELGVADERVRPAGHVGDHRVVDDQLGGGQRVDPGGVAAELGHGVAHGGQVDHGRHAGEVLHQHPRRGEGDLPVGRGGRVPAGEGLHVLGGDRAAVLGAEQVLEQDLQRVRQPRDVAGGCQRVQPEHLERPVADVEPRPGPEAVARHLSALRRVSVVRADTQSTRWSRG